MTLIEVKFFRTAVCPLFDHKSNEDTLKDLKVETDKKIRRNMSNWLRRVTRVNKSRMPKIKLNYSRNGRRQLGKTSEDTIRQGRNRYIKD